MQANGSPLVYHRYSIACQIDDDLIKNTRYTCNQYLIILEDTKFGNVLEVGRRIRKLDVNSLLMRTIHFDDNISLSYRIFDYLFHPPIKLLGYLK